MDVRKGVTVFSVKYSTLVLIPDVPEVAPPVTKLKSLNQKKNYDTWGFILSDRLASGLISSYNTGWVPGFRAIKAQDWFPMAHKKPWQWGSDHRWYLLDMGLKAGFH